MPMGCVTVRKLFLDPAPLANKSREPNIFYECSTFHEPSGGIITGPPPYVGGYGRHSSCGAAADAGWLPARRRKRLSPDRSADDWEIGEPRSSLRSTRGA